MEIKNLTGIHYKDILDVFNKSFSDYYVPMKLTVEQLKSKMVSDKINRELSVGAFENDKLVGFILHGLDTINNKKVIYNAGTGVIPDKRGIGLTTEMYKFIIPYLEKHIVSKIILEVIHKNKPAIKSYAKVGFKATRDLACFKGSIQIKKNNADIKILKFNNYNWDLLKSFWDIGPTLQNSINVINQSKHINISLGAYLKKQLIGYIIYNPKSKRIRQIAVHKNYRNKGIASNLISSIATNYDKNFTVINIDKNSKGTIGFFTSIGFKKYIEQLEMELLLKS